MSNPPSSIAFVSLFAPCGHLPLNPQPRLQLLPLVQKSAVRITRSHYNKRKIAHTAQCTTSPPNAPSPASLPRKRTGSTVEGRVFVVGDNIDTDQIIPAEYLTLVPSDPDEYIKLGSFAMVGLPADAYPTRYVQEGKVRTEFPIIVAGSNFGCGSSREHAPVAIGAAGGVAVIAASYARIFFRNCSATGELYPWECEAVRDYGRKGLVDEFDTGDWAVIDFDALVVRNVTKGTEFSLKELGDVLPVVDAGGIFEYARRNGMISTTSAED